MEPTVAPMMTPKEEGDNASVSGEAVTFIERKGKRIVNLLSRTIKPVMYGGMENVREGQRWQVVSRDGVENGENQEIMRVHVPE